MSNIGRPPVETDTYSRHVCCLDAMDAAFKTLVIEAAEAGWTEQDALAAISELADNHMLGLFANDGTAELIALVKRMT